MDMKAKKLTVIGTVDPVQVVNKLRKYWQQTELFTVGPAKEPEKKEEPKKEEAKKEEPKKEEAAKKEEPKKGEAEKKEEPKKEEGEKKEEPKKEEEKKPDPDLELLMAYRAYYSQMKTQYYHHSMEENPNACVIL